MRLLPNLRLLCVLCCLNIFCAPILYTADALGGSFSENNKWTYHPEHGWLYSYKSGFNGVFYYDVAMGSWLWTSIKIYPWFFHATSGIWIYYHPGGNSGERWFWFSDTEKLEKITANPVLSGNVAPDVLLPGYSFYFTGSIIEVEEDEDFRTAAELLVEIEFDVFSWVTYTEPDEIFTIGPLRLGYSYEKKLNATSHLTYGDGDIDFSGELTLEFSSRDAGNFNATLRDEGIEYAFSGDFYLDTNPPVKLTPPAQTVFYVENSYTFEVTSESNWFVDASSDWVDVLPESGNGNGTITVNVSSNNSYSPRSSYIMVEDQSHQLVQLGLPVTPAVRIITLEGELNFGGIPVGESTTRNMTISNTGNSTLAISHIVYPEEFGGDLYAGKIAAGESLNVIVRFTPTKDSHYNGTIVVVSDALDGMDSISVSGSGRTTEGGMVLVEGGMSGDVVVPSFYIGKYEVTWEEWQQVVEWAYLNETEYEFLNTANVCEGNFPVYGIDWYETVKWCNAKSEMDGLEPVYYLLTDEEVFRRGLAYAQEDAWNDRIILKETANGYRLPEIVEWEYAARGGTQTHGYTYSGSNTLDAVAWYRDNSSGAQCGVLDSAMRGIYAVGLKLPNELGLYDMNGNVNEWCWDDVPIGSHWRSHPEKYAIGGSSYSSIHSVSERTPSIADSGSYMTGFRLARNAGD